MHTEGKWVRALPWALLVLALGLPLTLALFRERTAKELDDLGPVPSFRLTERSGRQVSRDDLLGSPWVASFVYTRCEGPCPMLTGRMAKLAERAAAKEVRLVSISVDPEHDTPEALRAYADRYGAPPDRWLFLTGDVDEVRRLVRDGFHLAMAKSEPGSPTHGGPLTHSTRIVLVDGEGRIRRTYLDGVEPWVEDVLADLDALPPGRGRG